MKNLVVVLFALIFSISAWAKEIKVSVKGMVCGFCAQGITKKFKAEPAVDSVIVSLEKKTVVLQTKDGKNLGDQQIKDILTDAGYNIESIQRQ